MENFAITVDLKSFFDDYRAKSVIFVDTTAMKKVKHVVQHIKTVFCIESDACMFSQDNFVPGAEDCRVLKSLPSIRLEPLLSSSKQQNYESGYNVNEEDQDLVSVPTIESNQSKISNVDNDGHSNSGHASKKKKHKRKRVDSDSQSHEYSSNHQDRSDDLPPNSNSLFCSQDSKVRKILNSNARSLYPDSHSKSDGNESKKEDTPNGAFYKKVHKLACKIDKMIAEVPSVREDPIWTSNDTFNVSNVSKSNSSTVDEALTDHVGSDSTTNTDVMAGKPKRKRVRKRKKAAKPEDVPKDTEISVPKSVRLPPFKSSKLSTFNSNHIFFSEEGQEEPETPAKMPEAKKSSDEGSCVSVLLQWPDNKTEELEEQELNNQCSASNDANEGQEIKHQPSVSNNSFIEHGINDQSNVSEDHNKPSGTDVIQTVISKPKLFSVQVERGLGKLLSLVRSDSPPVFERKKVIKTVQLPVKQATPVVVLPQAEQVPKPSSTLQSSEIITPLKTIPVANTKISFKILKMSASYCPELSNSIMAIVKEVNQETQELSLKLISGAEECKQPKGKFDLCLEDAEEDLGVDEIKLSWRELIEPCICT